MLPPLKKDEKVIGHLPLGENGKFAKTIFYLLRADTYAKCNITVVGKAVNLGGGDGMQVPCILHLSGQKSMVEILKQQKTIKELLKMFIKNKNFKENILFYRKCCFSHLFSTYPAIHLKL